MKFGRESIKASQPKEGNDPRKCGNLPEPFPWKSCMGDSGVWGNGVRWKGLGSAMDGVHNVLG